MTRVYGRTLGGQRVCDCAPAGHWNTTTLVAALGLCGPLAPMVLPGSMDGISFEIYVEKVLLPALPKNAIVVMDNLSSHKSPRIASLIQAGGFELRYLPPYSPDFNPIEQMWSKVKAYLKGKKARTEEALFEAIGEAISQVTLEDARGYFSNCIVGIIS